MYLDAKTARKLIDMNPFPQKGFIPKDVAERQFQVVLKGFNHLIQLGNDFLYIADEVGLGKTYIAIGIASLLRHFSDHYDKYLDAVIVPRQNLQYKWLKELRNFISNNYIFNDNIVKSVIGKPIGKLDETSILHKMLPVTDNKAQYLIMRNSSFSIASYHDLENGPRNQWISKLKENLPAGELRNLFSLICRKHRGNHMMIKRAYAILLNTLLPDIDLLIVDEAHNYKHGVSDEVAIRNQIVSRLFGAIELDNDFREDDELSELKKLYTTQKVKKLLFLSATPINNGLPEIKHQLDCFMHNHNFKNIAEDKLADTIESKLHSFLMRGVMHIKLNKKVYSRNCYRHEHRKGNVDMLENAVPQTLKDEKIAAVLALIQYKTIKELKLNNNNTFEMGMLAGFESFSGSKSEYEYKTVDDKSAREAKDENVIQLIVESYSNEFGTYPPHPKQESLIEELFDLIINRKKALVFVRRIISVREIERKLFQKYTAYLIDKVEEAKGRRRIPRINQLLDSYANDRINDDIEKVLDRIPARIDVAQKNKLLQLIENDDSGTESNLEDLIHELRELYYSNLDNGLDKFRKLVREHAPLSIIRQDLKTIAVKLLFKQLKGEMAQEEEEEDEFTTMEDAQKEDKTPYFFQRFFNREGRAFKKHSYNQNWYELNYLLINDFYFKKAGKNLFNINNSLLKEKPDFANAKTIVKHFEIIMKKITQAINSTHTSHEKIPQDYRADTFLTTFLTELCPEEFRKWLDKYHKRFKRSQYTELLDELESLNEILKSIFRQGSGLLPAYIAYAKAEAKKTDFISEMIKLLKVEFRFVLEEIKDIINDYEKLIERNFDSRDKIRFNLLKQLPLAGVSGYHKRDVRKMAIQFRMPGYPYILIATDILKEGEDLHSYCSNVYHYGIAWNASDMEQRTGRIDRIDSLAYNKIKKGADAGDADIAFTNKLQVFFPYLADTLEVNQMVKLFKGMDDFIDIFYHNVARKIKKESNANVDEFMLEIPEQKTGTLHSKYDHENFCLKIGNSKACKQRTNLKITKAFLHDKINLLFQYIVKQGDFIVKPNFDSERLIISGVYKVNGNRNGPFRIFFEHAETPGEFILHMESCLGRVQVFSRKKNLNIVDNVITKNQGISKIERNSYIWLGKQVMDFDNTEEVHCQLNHLVNLTDKLEEELTGDDDQEALANL